MGPRCWSRVRRPRPRMWRVVETGICDSSYSGSAAGFGRSSDAEAVSPSDGDPRSYGVILEDVSNHG